MYRGFKDQGSADEPSRLSSDSAFSDPGKETFVDQASNWDVLPVRSDQIAVETKLDPTLSRVLEYMVQHSALHT